MKAPERLHHLDFLRASMMFVGVLVHASHADYDLGNYEWVRFLSGSFRMACFFVISGYFSPALLERYGALRFLLRRLIILGVPTSFCVFVLNPPAISALLEYFATAPVPAEAAIDWPLHTWFLVVLIVYTLAVQPLLFVTGTLCRQLARVCREGWAEAIIMLALMTGASVGFKVVDKWGPRLPGFDHYVMLLEPTLEYLPYFTFGLLMQRSPVVFAFVHSRPKAWGLAATALLAVRRVLEQHAITTTSEHLAHLAVEFTTAFACSFALLSLAQKLIRRPQRWVESLSQSAYTVYVVHYLAIAQVLVHTQRWGFSLHLRALSAAVIALFFGLSIHVGLVKRVPLVAFLLNGKAPSLSATRPLPG